MLFTADSREGGKPLITGAAHCHEIIIIVRTIAVNPYRQPSCDCLLTRPRRGKTKRSSSVLSVWVWVRVCWLTGFRRSVSLSLRGHQGAEKDPQHHHHHQGWRAARSRHAGTNYGTAGRDTTNWSSEEQLSSRRVDPEFTTGWRHRVLTPPPPPPPSSCRRQTAQNPSLTRERGDSLCEWLMDSRLTILSNFILLHFRCTLGWCWWTTTVCLLSFSSRTCCGLPGGEKSFPVQIFSHKT